VLRPRGAVAATFIEGRFEDVAASLGAFDVVTIGRAIHWLDPGPPRAALDRVVAPRGRILVCNAGSVEDGRNPWLKAFNAVRDRWKDDRPTHDPNAFFAGGRFVPVGTISVEAAAYAVPVERLADRILSMSTSSPERLGDEVPAIRSAVREALAPFAAAGVIDEIVEARAEVFDRVGGIDQRRRRLICNDRTGAGRSETRSRSKATCRIPRITQPFTRA
jgi:hypothetical protein